MARILPRSLANVRHLLLALIAIGLVLRMGAGCEAMAATPSAPAAHQAHCADMPAKPGKPIKADAAACALCVALPDASIATIGTALAPTVQPVASLSYRLAGLVGGPAPPPPKIA
ncbi:hypothetical protein [Sphingomonas oryzagri]